MVKRNDNMAEIEQLFKKALAEDAPEIKADPSIRQALVAKLSSGKKEKHMKKNSIFGFSTLFLPFHHAGLKAAASVAIILSFWMSGNNLDKFNCTVNDSLIVRCDTGYYDLMADTTYKQENCIIIDTTFITNGERIQ